METQKKAPCLKKEYRKISYEEKLRIIEEINNGQISVNYASKKYEVSRSLLDYWNQKLSNFSSKSRAMGKNEEIKKLKDKLEELEFIKDFQQDYIAELERITGDHLSKKYLPEALAKEIEQKRKRLLK